MVYYRYADQKKVFNDLGVGVLKNAFEGAMWEGLCESPSERLITHRIQHVIVRIRAGKIVITMIFRHE